MRYPPGLTDTVRTDSGDLGAVTGSPKHFDPEATPDLPDPVRRWLAHAIAPGAALLTSAELATHGTIQLGGWRGFTGRDGSFGVRVFGADFTDEATFDGFTIPRTVVAGWDHGTPGWAAGQFIRYTVDKAGYR